MDDVLCLLAGDVDDVALGDPDADLVDHDVTGPDEEAAVHRPVDELVDVLRLNVRWQLANCRCSGCLHDGLLDVDVVETILLRIFPDVDGSIVDLASILDDVATDGCHS